MKKKFPKRLLAWLLTCTMVFGLTSATAFAAEPDTDTTVTADAAVEENETDVPQTTDAEEVVEEETAETNDAVVPEADDGQEEQALPESAHDYENNYDNTWSYIQEDAADGVVITFDEQTEVESNYDFIYVLDANDNEVGKYTGKELAGASIAVPTAEFKIRLTSDKSGVKWGFKVTKVEKVEKGNLEQAGTTSVARISSQMITAENPTATPEPVVTYIGTTLENGTDYTVSYQNNDKAGTATVTIKGTGIYYGTLETSFEVVDADNLLDPAECANGTASLRQSGDTSRAGIAFKSISADYAEHITSVTLTPVESDGSPVDTYGLEYPYAPKEIILDKSALTVSGSSIYFTRTAEEPVVYVMEGHDPIEIKGRWSTVTYPQSQIYKVTVKADNYKDAEGTVTYYTGTAPAFSIIVQEEDGTQTTVKTWTSDELKEMATFANGSSQCGMTGFRTFSGEGVVLKDLLDEAGVDVSADDYFLLDTSDHYGNKFTYDELFNTTRYFLKSIYDDDFADVYNGLVTSDSDSGATIALRRYLAEQCLADNSTVEPRINVKYVESMISGDELKDAVLPTEENTSYNDLVAYENQFRFFYGIALTKEDCKVTFDTQGGSDVAAQTVLSHTMTSTSNTTIKSSYWANSLVIYRGQGKDHPAPAASTAAEKITVPENPTKEGYKFGGWYTDKECTKAFDFTANDGTVDQDTTFYAKWIGLPESDHEYANSYDNTWSYTKDDAENGVVITFDEQTEVESGYDFIYILDANDNEIGKYTGKELAGASVAVPTAEFKIRLTSDRSGTKWGFKVTKVENVEKGNLEQAGTSSVARIPSQMLTAENPVATPEPVVTYIGTTLKKDTDYTVSYKNNDKAGKATVVITGTGDYYGTLEAEFDVVDADNLLTPAECANGTASLRQAGDTSRAGIAFKSISADYAEHITSVTLTPVESDGSPVDTKGAEYPYAPKEITLDKDALTVSGNSIYFTRKAEEPVVYVMEGHDPIEIKGRWSTVTYPQSQIYKVTVKADNYKDAEGTVTYYTGTAPAFSIIVQDEDGTQTTVKSWTSEEIAQMSTFANGSSQCGMTGFRTFSGEGVVLKDLLDEAGVDVSADDYFLLDTSDHYGNKFTYDELFNTTRYFLQSIYDDDFADVYNELVKSDDDAGATLALRRYLAEKCLEDNSTVEPRINVKYVESMISGSNLKDAVLPTKDNTSYNDLVAYENQFRFFYGIALTQDECTVTFDSQGGSDVDAQTVLSHTMTSTSNTTIKSSYWANSLVIYRGQGKDHVTEPSTAAKKITVPTDPTKEGYVFGGWYKDEACTEKFDFNDNDGTVEQNTTLYAKWIPEAEAVTVTDFNITNVEHDDADAELNQKINVTIDFSDEITIADAEKLKDALTMKISGGNVNDTSRDITYSVNPENPKQLMIQMTSTGWVAIYNGMLTVEGYDLGEALVPASGKGNVVVRHLEGRIPIGIVVNNDVLAEGTDTVAASTYVNVAHKANMRGMYFFELVRIVDGQEEVIGGPYVSHAHNFYGSINEAAIASAMASAINKLEGYTTTYVDGETNFTVTADNASAGETIAVRMNEYKGTVNYAHTVVIDEAVAPTEDTTGLTEGSHCSVCGKVLEEQKVLAKRMQVEDFNITNVEHDDADGELNQKINVTIDFSEPITIDADKLKDELTIKIAGGDVKNTSRDITYSVNPENPKQLMIQMTSTDWVAIYNGMLTIEGTETGDAIKDAAGNGKVGYIEHLEGRIPIGIVVNNDVLAEGTDTVAASTYVNVAHKANMRGMYFFELVRIVDGQEEVIGGPYVSHAHNFYGSINEAAIASAMASAINKLEGYTTTYVDGETNFTVTADSPLTGETIAVRMSEYKGTVNYAHTVVIDEGVAPTDTTPGLTEGSHCSVCGTVLEEQKEIPALRNGWTYVDGNWYYYDKDGMFTGGWKQIGSTYYYLYEDGHMAADEWIGEYYVNASGAWVQGRLKAKWMITNGKWWYRNEDGTYPSNGWRMIDGQWYHFDASGYMQTGWLILGNTWYYLTGSGAMATGWTQVGNALYYLNASGAMQTGWVSLDGSWYFLNASGALQTGWIYVNRTWYYGDPETGALLEDEWLDDTYYLRAGGSMATGWALVDGVWYYFNASGVKQTSTWVGNYYVKEDGTMATDEWIGNYYVDANGLWVPGKTK